MEKAKALQLQNKELKSMLIEKENELNRVRKENQGLRDEIKTMLDPIGGGSLLREVRTRGISNA